jgi:hypothetical protein
VVQVPNVGATSHASHWPLHAVSQQKPSTQFPERQFDGDEHVAPVLSTHSPMCPNAAQVPPAHAFAVQQTPVMQVRFFDASHGFAGPHALPLPIGFTHCPDALQT